ncbi:MAG: DNA gyrase subunit A [Candidatus Omnitrophota bacterium]|nr:DNA gyrase subunit A [Candidatus Omnitrophota bacterium]
MYTKGEKIISRYIEDEVKDSYIDYAMSVIVGRALPDARDGLKPVHRRILYSMKDLGLEHSKPYKKCARITGETLGKYHPHGDTAVYDALVRMVQKFSLRYPLIDGQGNFGSVDGDSAAAMRYTEARLASITGEMLTDIDKNTVDFAPNFDGSLNEPTVLPARIPNLLINGSSGIAVGMATNVPPHNLKETISGIIKVIDDPEVSLGSLMQSIPGPDFPTGGIICGREGIKKAYQTGKGLIQLRARALIETQKKSGKESIIVTELPYQVNKANLIESIARLIEAKKIEGIADLRDESDRDGMRMVVELRRGQNAQIVLNQLYKHTQMQVTYGIIMLALVHNRPRLLSLKQLISSFIEHRELVITRRTIFELEKAKHRAHILEGLKIALRCLDKIIKAIRSSKTVEIAKEKLIKDFSLSEIQAKAILEMQLQRLTGLEREKIEKEYLDVIKKIELYESILKSRKKVLAIIKEELLDIKKRFGDERCTEIVKRVEELDIEDLIAEEDVVIPITHSGYIKRVPLTTYKVQRRGGRGVSGADIKEEDFIEDLFIAATHDHILFFTDKGKIYWLKVHEIPAASRLAKGRAVINLLSLSAGENITSFIPVKEFDDKHFLVMATRNGLIKKVNLSAFSHPRKNGIMAINLEKSDRLISAGLTDGKKEILLVTKEGRAIRFKESLIRSMGRSARGVKGVRLGKKDEVIGMEIVEPKATLFTITTNGYGKRTFLSQYRLIGRGGKGVINIKTSKKNGTVAGVETVVDDDQLMVITESGMVVRCASRGIRVMGRNTQGVKIISLKSKDKVVSIAKIVTKEGEE